MPAEYIGKYGTNPAPPDDTTNHATIGFDTTNNSLKVVEDATATGLHEVALEGGIRYREVALTAAQMLALRATPITLVAAPGAGKVLSLIEAAFIYDYVAAFTESADNLAIRYTDGSGATASTTLETTGLLDATSDQIRTFKQITTDVTPVANAALVIHNTGDGELGGTGSPCRVKIWYSVWQTGL